MQSSNTTRAIKQLKAAARSVVALTSGLVAGARQVQGSAGLLPQHLRLPHPAIDALLQSIPRDAPDGESRLYVSDQELVSVDERVAQIEAAHRAAVLLECKRIYFACSEYQRQTAAASPESSGSENAA